MKQFQTGPTGTTCTGSPQTPATALTIMTIKNVQSDSKYFYIVAKDWYFEMRFFRIYFNQSIMKEISSEVYSSDVLCHMSVRWLSYILKDHSCPD